MKLRTYKHWLGVNAGFEKVIRNLAGLGKDGAFRRRELERYSALSKEARAATNSYIAGVLEHHETDEAGRISRRRRNREQREERGSP